MEQTCIEERTNALNMLSRMKETNKEIDQFSCQGCVCGFHSVPVMWNKHGQLENTYLEDQKIH